MNWVLLFLILLLMSISGTVYLITRFHRFSFIERLGERHKVLSWLIYTIGEFGLMFALTVLVTLIF